jgi:SNF2 family DNA or RNA helicase
MTWAEILAEDTEHIIIGAEMAEHHLAQQLPGCNYSKERNTWKAPLSWATYVSMQTLWAAQGIELGPNLTGWAWDAWKRVERAYEQRAALDESAAPEPLRSQLMALEEGSVKKLYPPQRGGAVWLAMNRAVILNDPQGGGKTPQVIRAIQLLHAYGSACPALIIGTVSALRGWEKELSDWAPELSVRIIEGSAARRRKLLVDEPPADVTLISWASARAHSRLASFPGVRFKRCTACGGTDEQVKPGSCQVHRKELNEIPWVTVVADEAHRLGNAKSQQTRAVWWLMHEARNRWPVTGTLIADNIGNFWPIGRALDPASFPAKSRYLDLFAIKNYSFNGGTEILDIRPDTAPAFHAFVQPLIRRIPREIALPWLPKRMPPVFRYPEMTPKQKTAYSQLAKEALADLEMADTAGNTMIPANTVVRFGRLCQLAGSMIELAEGEDAEGFTRQDVRLVLPSSKVDDLVEFLEDNPGPLVVAANSPRLVELAEHKFALEKITSAKITGDMPGMAREQAIENFQAGRVRVIFITSAGGESITLTAANTIYFLQPDPSFLGREQKISRVDRIGSEIHDSIRVVHAITPGTVEERLYQLGTEKEERANSLTNDRQLMFWLIAGGERAATT